MQPYQEEYIANCLEFNAMTIKRLPEDTTFQAYSDRLRRVRARKEALVQRNMDLLRDYLMPVLDHLPNANEKILAELAEYAGKLLKRSDGVEDVEQYCLIHRALLGLARQKNDRTSIIRELYWLGIGQHAVYNKVSGMGGSKSSYMIRMRLCFIEAAAYLKYFDEIEDHETRSYIMRSLANSALGGFATVGERTKVLKRSLQVFQDPYYREREPGLPWDRFVRQTHQLMISSLPHSGDRGMIPQDVADIMESAHAVYHESAEAAAREGKSLPARQVFHTSAIEYFCGILDLDGFLTILEEQTDAADSTSYSGEAMYRLISLPAFYCAHLRQHPDRIPQRDGYLTGLYQRIVDYIDAFPPGQEDETLFLYIRQVYAAFIETAHSITYGEFLTRMISRFSPGIHVHSHQVAQMADVLCGIILDEEPGFFDDIDFVRAVSDPEEKRRTVLEYACGCGRFHDVGKVNFLDLYNHTARQWMEGEYKMARLHTTSGAEALSGRPSTKRYAAAALGHHAWYDGTRGYPAEYKRLDYPERQMVDVIALTDWLAEVTDTGQMRRGQGQTFDEAVEAAIRWEGRRFSPLLTARLRDEAVTKRLKDALEAGRWEAYRTLYQR